MQSPVYAFETLDDAQLDNVVAGTQTSESPGDIARIPIMFSRPNGNSIDGEIVLQRISNQTSGSLILQDGAQSNLQSLININAVNSPVNVLLNLNININSSIGVLQQLNLQGRL
jgi:hypothetical protein